MDGVGFTPESAKRISDAVKGWEAFQPSLGVGGVQRRDSSKIVRVKLDDDISATDPVSGKMQRRKSDFSDWEDTAIEINNIYAIDSDHATAAAGDYIWVINQGNHWCEVQTSGGDCPPRNAIWTIILGGLPTSGSVDMSIHGTVLSAVAYNESVSGLQSLIDATALNGNVIVSGSAFNFVLEFVNGLGSQPITDVYVTAVNLKGQASFATQFLTQQGLA